MKNKWSWQHSTGLFLIVIAIGVVGLAFAPRYRFAAWLTTIVLLAIFALVAGNGITGIWRGMFVDERNKISLSRFQMIIWTIVVLSGFLVAALSNIAAGDSYPLSIEIPEQVWVLLGISTTSLVGSPLIRSTRNKPVQETEKTRARGRIESRSIAPGGVDFVGQVVVNNNIVDVKWSNLFEGEDASNAGRLDLGKVQMFYFTLIVVLAYAAALGAVLNGSEETISEFPLLDTSMIALLGISNAGYLTNKAIPPLNQS